MGNADKRAKRAKQKAKLARQQKQQSQVKSDREIFSISPDLIELFKTLPPVTPEFLMVPVLKEYYLHQPVRDVLMSVAISVIFYGHWKTTGSDVIEKSQVIMLATEIADNPEFLKQYYESGEE